MKPQGRFCIKVPGKLMLAGEFAVLEPHQPLVVTAVNRFIYVTCETSEEGSLTLESFQLDQLNWSYANKRVTVLSDDKRIRFVQEAMTITLNYLHEQNIKTTPFSLAVRSELDDRPGVKYGLGSSAAVVTGVVTAILTKFLPGEPAKDVIFKLAAITHFSIQGNGSCADIAASTYGGLVNYYAFDGNWLYHEIIQLDSVQSLVNKEWPCLRIETIEVPKTLLLCVGWTGSPASTSHLVKNVKKLQTENETQYQNFLKESKIAVGLFAKGLKTEDMSLVFQGIRKNRAALVTLGKHANTAIETPLLEELGDRAEQLDGAGKSSGAGGGDCGIAFVSTENEADRLKELWQEAGIFPLEMNIYPLGAHVI
ncbi:phosphomevalonate kinase [Ornithinibacillus sp. 4-3]|uniref:phosphomevalonate kinase n=1 Tax=Ornithinibacillus sp. 4-3 TaxID=3231488 RepID=A0AB39HRW6_9BACI